MDGTNPRAWLESLGEFHMAFGLDRIRALLARLGNPERSFRSIHIAGTNGKGATAAFLSSIFRAAGRRVGLYTSPHLSRPNERIAIGGRPIGDDHFARAVHAVRANTTGIDLTFFEAMTAAAFVAFREAAVEIAAVEVGLGGRLDATNVIVPAVAVVTHLSRDHVAVLGSDPATIAAEKAGILKVGVPAVCVARDPPAVGTVADRAGRLGVPLARLGETLDARIAADGSFELDGRAPGPVFSLSGVRLPIAGSHQRDNALAAVAAALLADPALDAATLRRGLVGARWPGRGETVSIGLLAGGAVEVVFDGAHNPGAARALADCLAHLPRARTAIVFAAMQDKEHGPVLDALAAIGATALFATSSGLARSAAPASLRDLARERLRIAASAHESPGGAFDAACAEAGPGGRVVVTGSLYLVGRIRETLIGPPGAIG